MLLLRATDEGEELLAKLRERRRGYMSEVLACMSVDELTTLAKGLASLVKATQDYEGENKETASR
jgi:DNA-binding MarR family transcriptional regulator